MPSRAIPARRKKNGKMKYTASVLDTISNPSLLNAQVVVIQQSPKWATPARMERIDPIKLTGLKGRLANPMMKRTDAPYGMMTMAKTAPIAQPRSA